MGNDGGTADDHGDVQGVDQRVARPAFLTAPKLDNT
jgi:hypothetical protein